MQSVIVGLHMIYICATNPTQKTNLGISPLKNEFSLFDTLCGTFQEFQFDNFYMSEQFAYISFIHQPKNIKVQGVFHISGRGSPNEVHHNEVKYIYIYERTWLVMS